MDITLVINETSPWGPRDYDSGLINGSEEMVVLLARELAKRDHLVTVYSSLTEGRTIDVLFNEVNVVNYYDRSYLNSHRHKGCLIAFKDPGALYIPGFNKKFLWTADATALDLTQRKFCNGLFAISKWHENELKAINLGFDRIDCIEPGVEIKEMFHVERIPKQCLYASSPDRGLVFLQSIWPEILKAHPDATLVTTYSSQNRRSNEEMTALYQQSDILAYPCMGEERYCLTAIKAQIHGCIPCVIPHMALKNTVQFGIKALKNDYLSAIIKLLDDNSRTKLREDMVNNVQYNTWGSVADQWERVIGKEENQDRGKS